MTIQLVKKPITLDEMPKKETVQIIKEKDLIVPDGKPDLQSIVELDGDLEIEQIDVSQDRVMYRGNINVCIIYHMVGNTKCLYTMKGTIPVEDFVIMDGINKDQRIDFDYNIEHISYNILNERKINIKTIMQITITAMGCKETTILTDANSEEAIEIKEDEMEIVSLCEEKEGKTIVKEDLVVANAKPCVGEILKTYVKIQDEQIKRNEVEIKYNGMIEVTTLYKSSEDDSIHIVSHRIPFEDSLEVSQSEEEVYWECKLSAQPSYVQVTPDYDGEDRIIECEVVVTAKYAIYNKAKYNSVSDIYCPGKKVSTKEKVLDYMNLKDKVEMDMPKKESIELEEDYGDSVEVVNVTMKPTLQDKTVESGKLTLKGILEIKMLLLCSNEEQTSMNTVVSVIPFSQDLDVADVKGNIIIEPCIEVKDINIYAQTKKEVVLEYRLGCAAKLYEQSQLHVVEEAEVEDMTKEELDAYPSMTVYQVKQGDTLWNLAKRYNTTVKDIQEINDLEGVEQLKSGQKIIILKKVRF